MGEHRSVLWGLALCAIVVVSLYPALSAAFVMDDNIFAKAPEVQTWSGIWNIWFTPSHIEGEGHYWPITYTTFWLEHKFWGLSPFGTHLVNLLLYMASVLLLWRLLRHLAVPGAWAVAAVFAVHPMHVESVAWAIGRKDLLSGLFCMAAVLCWIRSTGGLGDTRDSGPDSDRSVRPGLYLSALGLFVAAMLSKSVAVTLPVALVILVWWKNGRVTWVDAARIAPFFLVGLCIAGADLAYYTSEREFPFDYALPERVLIAARALWFYVGKLVWPADLAIIYPLWDIDVGDSLAWGFLIAAIAVVVVLWFGRHRLGRGPLAGAMLFAFMLSPVLGFVDFAYMRLSFVADRYAYLPGIGVIAVLIGIGAHGASKLSSPLRIAASGLLVAILAVLGKLTWEQSGIYRDAISFYHHILSFNPAASVHRNLAKALIDAGRLEDVFDASRMAVEQNPGSAGAHHALGLSLMGLGRLDEAAESFRRVLELDSSHTHARHNLAETLRHQGNLAESIESYREVLDIDRDFTEAYAGMGHALFHLGRYEEAAESLAKAVSLRPDVVPIKELGLLAWALRRLKRHEEAIETYRSILSAVPEYAPAHAGIGYALYQLKQYEEAIESLARSDSLQPESSDAADRHVAMGRASDALGRTKAAVGHFARALEIDARNAEALDSFAVLRFRQQRYEEALDFYENLVEMGEANARVHANMAAALYYLERPDEALRSLDLALSLDPSLAQTGLEKMRDALREERE